VQLLSRLASFDPEDGTMTVHFTLQCGPALAHLSIHLDPALRSVEFCPPIYSLEDEQ
jgi:hypothetical protein